ncbi:hypothetical protein D922_00203 [Enterococcus faecalis 06-MB-DW-09]|nr:hypothetical protein D931_00108 [Enterococcus faecium 13.SD.W.09]EPH97627.1 hypothetical protein D922_00203 [Enterococcus faecalis 06-MB-DW-09]
MNFFRRCVKLHTISFILLFLGPFLKKRSVLLKGTVVKNVCDNTKN